jgi:hypothetical protein
MFDLLRAILACRMQGKRYNMKSNKAYYGFRRIPGSSTELFQISIDSDVNC